MEKFPRLSNEKWNLYLTLLYLQNGDTDEVPGEIAGNNSSRSTC